MDAFDIIGEQQQSSSGGDVFDRLSSPNKAGTGDVFDRLSSKSSVKQFTTIAPTTYSDPSNTSIAVKVSMPAKIIPPESYNATPVNQEKPSPSTLLEPKRETKLNPPDWRPYQKQFGIYAPPETFTQIAPDGYVPYGIDEKIKELQGKAAEHGIKVRIGEVDRNEAKQAAYYAQGRNARGDVVGKTVTNAPPGLSLHQSHRAFDADPVRSNGQPMGDAEYRKLGEIARGIGLVWGGDFKSIYDPRHFEVPSKLMPPEVHPQIPIPEGLK